MNWFEGAVAQLTDDRNQGCESGHDRHDLKVAEFSAEGLTGRMTTFDAEKYRNTPGYCPGDDVVSRSIGLHGTWEPVETAIFVSILKSTKGIVIDFGSQIGWYSMLGTLMGHDVLAVEGVAEHAEITLKNAHFNGQLWQAHHWINENTPTLSATGCPPVAVVKMDLEGSEQHAVRCISDLIERGIVANILMEVSPVFNDSYPEIVGKLLARGYRGSVCYPPRKFTYDDYKEAIAEYPQVDMLFTRES